MVDARKQCDGMLGYRERHGLVMMQPEGQWPHQADERLASFMKRKAIARSKDCRQYTAAQNEQISKPLEKTPPRRLNARRCCFEERDRNRPPDHHRCVRMTVYEAIARVGAPPRRLLRAFLGAFVTVLQPSSSMVSVVAAGAAGVLDLRLQDPPSLGATTGS